MNSYFLFLRDLHLHDCKNEKIWFVKQINLSHDYVLPSRLNIFMYISSNTISLSIRINMNF